MWDSLAMELIPDVFLVAIDWWSEFTTSVIKRATLKSLYKIMRKPNEHFKLLQVSMNLYSGEVAQQYGENHEWRHSDKDT